MNDGTFDENEYNSPLGISNDDIIQMLQFGLTIEDLQASGIVPPDPPEQDSKPSAEEEEPEVDEDLIAIEDMLAMALEEEEEKKRLEEEEEKKRLEEEEEKKRRKEAKMDKIRNLGLAFQRTLFEADEERQAAVRDAEAALARERANRPTARPRREDLIAIERQGPRRPPPIRTDRFSRNRLRNYIDRNTYLTTFFAPNEDYDGDGDVQGSGRTRDEDERLTPFSFRGFGFRDF